MKNKLVLFAVCLLTVLCAAVCAPAESTVVDYSVPVQLPWLMPSGVTAVTEVGTVTYNLAGGTIPSGLLPELSVNATSEERVQFTLGASDENWSPEGPLDVEVSLKNLHLPENAALSLVRLDGQETPVTADFGLDGEDFTIKFRADMLGAYALIAKARKVSVVNRTGTNVVLGGTIDLEAVLTGFEGEDIVVIWEMDRGSGWEEAGTGLTYSYAATAESIRWQVRVRVRIAPEA